jgi:hypothetical protein
MPKVGKSRKGITNPGSGGKGWNFVIHFVRKQKVKDSVFLFSPFPLKSTVVGS